MYMSATTQSLSAKKVFKRKIQANCVDTTNNKVFVLANSLQDEIIENKIEEESTLPMKMDYRHCI